MLCIVTLLISHRSLCQVTLSLKEILRLILKQIESILTPNQWEHTVDLPVLVQRAQTWNSEVSCRVQEAKAVNPASITLVVEAIQRIVVVETLGNLNSLCDSNFVERQVQV